MNRLDLNMNKLALTVHGRHAAFAALHIQQITALQTDICALQEMVLSENQSYIIAQGKDMVVNVDWQSSKTKEIQSPGLSKLTEKGCAWAETYARRLFVTGGRGNEGVTAELVK